MSRYGLIFTVSLILFLLASNSTSLSSLSDSNNGNLKNFQEGVSLLKSNMLDEAFSKFKKSSDGNFILIDYTYLLMAETRKKLGHHEKALSYLSRIEKLGEPTTLTKAQKIYGEIYAELGKFSESFHSYLSYYEKEGMDKRTAKSFRDFTNAYQKMEPTEEEEKLFLEQFIAYLKSVSNNSKKWDSITFLDDVIHAYGKSNDLEKIYENLGSSEEAFEILMDRLIFEKGNLTKWLAQANRAAQRFKDYDLKTMILKEMLKLKTTPQSKAKIQCLIGLAYLNANRDSESIKYFKAAVKNAGKSYTGIMSNYYLGRIEEERGHPVTAVLYYRKARNAKYQNEKELNTVIKSLFRAGWVEYKLSAYKRAISDFGYIIDKFGNRLTEDGYAYWLGKALLKQNRLEEARSVFESLYSDFPMSYYGLLCALELKNTFNVEVPLKQFPLKDFSGPSPNKNERFIQRSLLLFSSGLEEFASDEAKRINLDYNNMREIYKVAELNTLFGNHRKAVSLTDFIINQKMGIPDDGVLKIYYPLKYMNFITNYSALEDVDPFMVISLIRQESIFHSDAVSKAQAMGLMQVLPSLGLKIALDKEIGDISERELLDPYINLKVGISHFSELMRKFGNNFILATAAYNSSEAKVKEWQNKYKNLSIFEFIENIPYFETRKYVKLTFRNYLNYLRIYTERDWYKVLP